MNRIKSLFAAAVAAFLIASAAVPAQAAPKKEFSIAWSIYVGWMPWAYAQQEGIVKKWADKYGIKLDVVQINDYVESINQYTAGKFDGVTLTNMDALTIPAAGGVDTTMLILGSFSNGNDGIVMKNGKSVADLKGKKVNLVELSVSHYLLARALQSAKMTEKDITVVNTSDADMVAAFKAKDVIVCVTWNPLLAEVQTEPGASLIYDSSSIPGEIIDTLSVNTATLRDNPDFGKALAGIWYETMSIMSDTGDKGKEARSIMAKLAGTDLDGYDAQLKTTKMFFDPKEAVTFTSGKEIIKTMDLVRSFSFEHGILGEGVKSKDAVGMAFAGSVLGNKGNIKLRFDPTYMKMAADGKL